MVYTVENTKIGLFRKGQWELRNETETLGIIVDQRKFFSVEYVFEGTYALKRTGLTGEFKILDSGKQTIGTLQGDDSVLNYRSAPYEITWDFKGIRPSNAKFLLKKAGAEVLQGEIQRPPLVTFPASFRATTNSDDIGLVLFSWFIAKGKFDSLNRNSI